MISEVIWIWYRAFHSPSGMFILFDVWSLEDIR